MSQCSAAWTPHPPGEVADQVYPAWRRCWSRPARVPTSTSGARSRTRGGFDGPPLAGHGGSTTGTGGTVTGTGGMPTGLGGTPAGSAGTDRKRRQRRARERGDRRHGRHQRSRGYDGPRRHHGFRRHHRHGRHRGRGGTTGAAGTTGAWRHHRRRGHHRRGRHLRPRRHHRLRRHDWRGGRHRSRRHRRARPARPEPPAGPARSSISEDFESDSVGATTAADWSRTGGSSSDWAIATDGTKVLQQDNATSSTVRIQALTGAGAVGRALERRHSACRRA